MRLLSSTQIKVNHPCTRETGHAIDTLSHFWYMIRCDVGIPGSRSCSNCRKAGVVCIFAKHRPHGATTPSPKMKAVPPGKASFVFKSKKSKRQRVLVMTSTTSSTPTQVQAPAAVNDEGKSSPSYQNLVQWIYGVFPPLDVNNTCTATTYPNSMSSFVYSSHPQQSLEDLEHELLDVYFCDIHPFFPILDDHHLHQGHMSHLLRCALLALSCAVARPTMLTLASSYADQANEQLERSPANIDTIQVLLILYKYQEVIAGGLSPLEYSTPSYLDRARDMHNRLWALNVHDPAVHRIRSMLYLIAFWSGLIEQRSTWIKWCSDCEGALEHFSSGHGGLDALVQITTRYRNGSSFNHDDPHHPHHHHYYYTRTTSPPPAAETALDGSVFEIYWSVIHDMTFLSSHNIYAAERIEQHVSHLLGTVIHHACILGSHMLVHALKLALHTYLCYYATATSSLPTSLAATTTTTHDDARDDIAVWTHARLTQLSQLFHELGAQPEIGISIQQLIHMLCDGHL